MSEFAIPGLMPLGSPIYTGMTGREPLRIRRGISFLEVWNIATTSLTAFTGYGVRAQARSGDCLAFDLAPTINASGEVRFALTATATRALPVGHFWTDLLLDHPSGTVEQRVFGMRMQMHERQQMTP